MRITGGVARGVHLVVPRASPARPTSDRVRVALFEILGGRVTTARVLDLFAGTGALGLEALSRGATQVDFVEQDARLCRAIRKSLATAGFAERAHVYEVRMQRALEFLDGPYDLVLLDPPYDYPELSSLLERLSYTSLVAPGGTVVVEHRSRVTTPEGLGSLHLVDRRRYGDTGLAFYRRGEDDGSAVRRDL